MSRALVISVTVALVLVQAGCENQVEEPKPAQYVKRQTCIPCHEEQYTEWSGSHHDLAMQVALEQTVLGDFNDAMFTHFGVTSKFFKKDGKFFIHTDGPDGKMSEFEVKYTFGFNPLQQYLIEIPDGRVQALDIAWDSHPKEQGGQRWFHLHPDEKITYDDILHWTGLNLNWNYMCAECHSTNLQKNFDLKTNTFKTTWSEINIGCQACHGPGSNHVEWARTIQNTGAKMDISDKLGLEVQLNAQDSRVQIEACARCHSRRTIVHGQYEYGKNFMDHYVPRLLVEPLYYADGQILDEVYVYGSFIQSKKYNYGVRCTDCHNPHTARLHSPGNALCVGCHGSSPPQRFTTLKTKAYDTPEHHFHKKGSPGSQCVECHMPATKYMVVDPRRDHSFLVPRPDLTVKLGTPNSCNGCHKDKSAQWSADMVMKWYPQNRGSQEQKPHFAEIIAAGRAGTPGAGPRLIKLAGDNSQPAIVRATALNLLNQYRNIQTLAVMRSSLKDIDPLVRYTAVRGISVLLPKRLGPKAQHQKLALAFPLLKDKVRAVRAEAARALTEVPADLLDRTKRQAFEAALDEYKQRQRSMEDRPEAHLNLGLVYSNLGQKDLAETSYKTAIRMYHKFIPARFNLANLYNSQGRNEEAEQQLRQILELAPDNGEPYYSLGLLLAELNRLDEAADYLAKAAELLPERARVRYNYALSLQHLGRLAEAGTEFLQAYNLDQKDPGILRALAIYYMKQSRWDRARPYAEELARIYPNAPEPRRLLNQIQAQMKKH